jgi:tripartite-type tricarboxylate transporter receptor subunit TctC
VKLPAIIFALLLPAAGSVANAEDWPARPVRIIAPFAPGGTADTLGRIAAEHLSESFQQQFFVENRGGAGGVTASLAVARMDPDGYNFVVSGIATHAIAPIINPNTGYDPVNDLPMSPISAVRRSCSSCRPGSG